MSRTYLANYSQHLEQKALEREANQAAFERQQKELGAQQAYIDRFRASATRSTQAKSREKLLDKVERVQAPIEGVSGPRFRFPPAPAQGAWWQRSATSATATATRSSFSAPTWRSSGVTASPLWAPTGPGSRPCCA